MSDASNAPFTVVILAAQRAGVVNAVAAAAGVSHKCLAPIAGRPLIAHVVAALDGLPGLGGVCVSAEPELHAPLTELLAPWRDRGMAIECVASTDNIVDSVTAALRGRAGPYLITTADNVLLSHAAIADTLAALRAADVVINLATQASVQAVNPRAQRKFYEFRDGGYANCNLYGIAGADALTSAEVFREGGQFMRNPGRLVRAFGLINIALMRFRLVTLAAAMKLASRRFRLRFRAIVPADGAQAVDVDNARTFAIAEGVLRARHGADGAWQPSTGSG